MVNTTENKLKQAFDYLTHPPIITDNVEENLRMRLISSLLLLQTIMCILAVLVFAYLQVNMIALSASTIFGVLIFLCYLVSRTHFYKWGVALYITLMISALFAIFISNHDAQLAIPEYTLSYLIAVLFFTSLMLGLRATIAIAVIILIGIASLPLVIDNLRYPIHYLWLFACFTSVLIIITSVIRRDVFRRLRASENQSRSLLEAYIDAVAIYSDKQGILAVNPAFSSLLGYKPSDVLHVPITNLAYDEASQTLITTNSHNKDKSAPFEVQLKHQNGDSVVVELISQPYTYDKLPVYMIVARDMRIYKNMLRKQHEHEIRYESLLELTDDAVIISDFEGTYIAVNQQAAKVLGLPEDQLIGKSFRDFVPDVYHTASQRVIERLLAGEAVPMYERTFIKHNGHRFPAEVMVRLLHDVDGKPEFIHSVIRDISERKHAEDQRIELAIERERMSSVQQFLKDASHYFRTPLTSLKTSQYLLTQIKGDPEKHAHFLNIMKLEIARLEHLLSDMMLSAQLERDSGNGLTFGRLDLHELLPEIVNTFSPPDKNKTYAPIVVSPEILPKTLYIMASRAKFFVAMHRLLENAINYSPADTTITVRAYPDEQSVCIEVKDEGIGITDEEKSMLFQRFRRGDRAVEMVHVGNGLGLFIVEKIVEMHYGEIKLKSQPDKGSTFTIVLPMALRPKRKS